MNEFVRIEVGKPFLQALGLGEGVRFDIGEGGCTLVYGFDRPTPEEVEAVKSDQEFEIRFVALGGIIWVVSKCGSLEWTDAPYNPRLSSKIPDPSAIADGTGLGLTLLMIDSRDAVVKSGRFIGLGTDFSGHLLEEAWKVRQKPMTRQEAGMSVAKTMSSYTTRQLANMAKYKFRLEA